MEHAVLSINFYEHLLNGSVLNEHYIKDYPYTTFVSSHSPLSFTVGQCRPTCVSSGFAIECCISLGSGSNVDSSTSLFTCWGVYPLCTVRVKMSIIGVAAEIQQWCWSIMHAHAQVVSNCVFETTWFKGSLNCLMSDMRN